MIGARSVQAESQGLIMQSTKCVMLSSESTWRRVASLSSVPAPRPAWILNWEAATVTITATSTAVRALSAFSLRKGKGC